MRNPKTIWGDNMRKQILLVLSILVMLLLLGCAAQQPAAQAQQRTQVDTTVKVETEPTPAPVKVETREDIITKKPEPEPIVQVAPSPQLPEKIQELITKAQTKVKSYKYLLSEPPENRFLNTYFIKGDKLKVKIYEGNAYKVGEYYDTVYLDLAGKTATARCEDDRRCVYAGEDYTRKVFEADYNEHITKIPTTWLDGLTSAELIGPEVVQDNSAIKIKTTRPGKIIEMWLHVTYGIPIQIAVTVSGKPTEMYKMADISFNNLKDSDVMPKFTTSQY